MNVTISPRKLHGAITPPPSKSQAHRLIMAAALADGESIISNVAFSQDILATLSCMERLGASWEKLNESTIRVQGICASRLHPRTGELPHFDCGESGSTLRFLIPIALAVTGGGVFTGHGRLMERPQKPYFDLFDEKGIYHHLENGVLTVRGVLRGGEYALPGNVSSQFFTGLLYALPLLKEDSCIRSTTALESWSYIDLTLDALFTAGVMPQPQEGMTEDTDCFFVCGGGHYRPCDRSVEGDWSQAGFYYAARTMGNDLEICGLEENSGQGDRAIAAWCELLGKEGEVSIDVSDCPDLVPPLAACAALRGNGVITHITGAARLRIKESDRLSAVTQVMNALGADIEELPDGLNIRGVDELRGGTAVDAHNDHRIAMMAAVAATRCKEAVRILGAECVRKSYPNFWEDYEMLGGVIQREEEKA